MCTPNAVLAFLYARMPELQQQVTIFIQVCTLLFESIVMIMYQHTETYMFFNLKVVHFVSIGGTIVVLA